MEKPLVFKNNTPPGSGFSIRLPGYAAVAGNWSKKTSGRKNFQEKNDEKNNQGPNYKYSVKLHKHYGRAEKENSICTWSENQKNISVNLYKYRLVAVCIQYRSNFAREAKSNCFRSTWRADKRCHLLLWPLCYFSTCKDCKKVIVALLPRSSAGIREPAEVFAMKSTQSTSNFDKEEKYCIPFSQHRRSVKPLIRKMPMNRVALHYKIGWIISART